MRLLPGLALTSLLFLNACSLLEPAPPPRLVVMNQGTLDSFHLTGRISVKADEQSFSGNIDWRHQGLADEILLSAPLGQGVAQLQGSQAGVALTDSEGHRYEAVDAETLLRTHLGISLPLRGLLHWLDAKPRPGSAYEVEGDGDGRMAALLQDGWRIDYGRYSREAERWLPGKLFARHGESLEFRLVVDEWLIP